MLKIKMTGDLRHKLSRFLLLTMLVWVAACTPRDRIVFVDRNASGTDVRSVFIATSRAQDGAGYGSDRIAGTTYLRYDMSVPPNRQPGVIEVPRSDINPNTQFLGVDRVAFADARNFRAELAKALRKRAASQREAVIYVHGFNNSFDEGVLRLTQLSADFDDPGVAIHYSWPSAGNPLGYAYDRDSILVSRDNLDALITDVRAAGARSILLVAHSVGSMLVMETLRQRAIAQPGSVSRDIAGVVLISPDIDVDLFKSQARRVGELPSPFAIFVSENDRALSLSARITGHENRLGNIRDVSDVSEFNVTVLDVTNLADGGDHFAVATSPAIISIFRSAGVLEAAFRNEGRGQTGLVPGTILSIRNATEIILSPISQSSE